MFKAKYQLHRLVNILFYGIFWVSGLLVGLGLKGSGIFEKIKEIFFNLFH